MGDIKFQLILCRVGHFYPQYMKEDDIWSPDFCPFCTYEGFKKLKVFVKALYPINSAD